MKRRATEKIFKFLFVLQEVCPRQEAKALVAAGLTPLFLKCRLGGDEDFIKIKNKNGSFALDFVLIYFLKVHHTRFFFSLHVSLFVEYHLTHFTVLSGR